MRSDDITKLGLMLARMKLPIMKYTIDQYTSAELCETLPLTFLYRFVFLYYLGGERGITVGYTTQDLEYLAEQNEEAKQIIVKLTLNGDLK